MALKSILVHLANDPGHAGRLHAACLLARRHDAHVTAVFATTFTHMPNAVAGRGASRAFLTEAREAARERAAELERELAEIGRAEGMSFAFHADDGEPIEVLVRQSRLADLAIVSTGRSGESGLEAALAEQLPLQASCPVLGLAEGWHGDSVAERALVAWNGKRESGRALRDALPLLARARSVTVATIGDEAGKLVPAVEVVRYLARHGVEAQSRQDYGSEDHAGAVLLSIADEIGADLVVMGAYGHSRLRELVLGGVTRHVIEESRLPVLFSH